MGQWDDTLFAVLARQAKQRLGEFNAQELANTAWAFAWACVGAGANSSLGGSALLENLPVG